MILSGPRELRTKSSQTSNEDNSKRDTLGLHSLMSRFLPSESLQKKQWSWQKKKDKRNMTLSSEVATAIKTLASSRVDKLQLERDKA